MRLNGRSFALATVIATVAIAGCGGGGSSSSSTASNSTSTSSTGTELSASAYAVKLKGLFCPLGSALQTLGTQASSATTKQELESALKGANAKLENTINGLEQLSPPGEASAPHKALIAALQRFDDSVNATEKAIASGSKSQITSQVKTFQSDAQTFSTTLTNLKSDFQKAGVKPAGSC
jgi:hypothetical protein